MEAVVPLHIFCADLSAIGFNATCLCDNTARYSAIVNDYSWDDVYLRQLTHLQPKDVLIAVSVHGGKPDWSNNLVKAVEFAKEIGAETLALSGCDGGHLAKICSLTITVPDDRTPVIEGLHCVLTHVIRQKIEELRG